MTLPLPGRHRPADGRPERGRRRQTLFTAWLLPALWALLWPLLWTAPVHAAPAEPAQSQQETGLLWRLESPQGVTSHLFGTMHSSDPRITTLAAPVQAAFDHSKQVVLELDLDPGTLLRSAALLMYADQRRLSDDVPEPLLSEIRHLGTRRNLPFMVLDQMKPWAVAVTLASPKQKQGEFLDLKLASAARSSGKTIIGLETPDEQLRTFNALSMAQQLELLRDVVEQYDELPAFFRQLEDTYLRRDLSGILALSEQDMEKADAELSRQLLDGLIVGRNLLMVERMQPALQQGDSFIAVGALHLPGPNGLLQLLKERGYRVSAVY